MKSNHHRTWQRIPKPILKAIDHVREHFPVVDMVVFNDMGRWQFMGEDFEKVKFATAPIDISILEEAAEVAYRDFTGGAVAYQAYTSEP